MTQKRCSLFSRSMIIATGISATCLVAHSAPALAQTATGEQMQEQCPPEAEADRRAREVLAAMTLDEKLAMLSGTSGLAVRARDPSEKRIGAGHVVGVPRLGIPDLWETDASLGVANPGELRPGDVATALPSSLATAATFDPELAYAGGAMIGSEARAKGFNVLLAGGANLVRDPWGGRAFEYLSEDVLLTGVQAGESIRGVQSNDIVSTLKHFALNPQESGRYVVDARISEPALHESDLLAFEIAIDRGQPGSVMAAYNKVNGDWASENQYLLTQVLRTDWDYDGWVMSDWGSVHSTDKAALAGLDQQSGREFDRAPYFAEPLAEAVAAGRIPEILIDEKVLRILRPMFRLGLVDRPTPSMPQPIDYEANADVAQRIAEAGIVLLRNERRALPLSDNVQKVAVIGGKADIGVLSGGGSSQVASVGGFALEIPQAGTGPFAGLMTRRYHKSSPLEALRKRAPDAQISFADGTSIDDAVALARDADVAIIFAEEWRTEVLDQASLNLTADQEALIEAVAKSNRRTIVVLETGGPVIMPWLDQVEAVLAAWYPGQRGGEAIARVLFGDVDASGRLPVTFPATLAQAPRPEIPNVDEALAAFKRLSTASFAEIGQIGLAGGQESFPVEYREGADAGYRWYAKNAYKPAFPFGFGLSYTDFSYSNLVVHDDEQPGVSLTMTNTGSRAGIDVAQVYASRANGVPVLVGFQRVSLAPGESKTVRIELDLRPIQEFDAAKRARKPITERITLAVSRSAGDPQLTATIDP